MLHSPGAHRRVCRKEVKDHVELFEKLKARMPPRCGGRLRVVATVQDPTVVRTILAHAGRELSPEAPGPAPPAPAAIG